MPANGYRLDSPLLAIEKYDDGRSTLRVLVPGTELIVVSPADVNTGRVTISAGQQKLEVFQTDLDDRSSRVVLDRRMAVNGSFGHEPSAEDKTWKAALSTATQVPTGVSLYRRRSVHFVVRGDSELSSFSLSRGLFAVRSTF